jgi:hypothetical protein
VKGTIFKIMGIVFDTAIEMQLKNFSRLLIKRVDVGRNGAILVAPGQQVVRVKGSKTHGKLLVRSKQREMIDSVHSCPFVLHRVSQWS